MAAAQRYQECHWKPPARKLVLRRQSQNHSHLVFAEAKGKWTTSKRPSTKLGRSMKIAARARSIMDPLNGTCDDEAGVLVEIMTSRCRTIDRDVYIPGTTSVFSNVVGTLPSSLGQMTALTYVDLPAVDSFAAFGWQIRLFSPMSCRRFRVDFGTLSGGTLPGSMSLLTLLQYAKFNHRRQSWGMQLEYL